MNVARLHGRGDIRLAEAPIPEPGPGMQLVRVTAVGLCGSDLHWYTEGGIGDAQLSTPLVVGHEFAGVIEGGERNGQRVAVDPAIPCGRCATCATGSGNLCPSVVFSGHGEHDGALREYMAWPDALCHDLPDSLSDSDGAVLEPLGIAVHALDLCHVRVGTTVGVFGCGPIGLLLLQVARAAGATTVIASDLLEHRRQAATRLGADVVLDGSAEDAMRGFENTVDVAFEVAGNDAAVRSALVAAKPGARVGLIGIPEHDRTTFTASLARRKGLLLVMVRRMNDVYPRAIRLARSGMVDVASLVTHHYPLAQVADAFTTAADRRGLKVVVHPTDGAEPRPTA